jgi:hypothetical protein
MSVKNEKKTAQQNPGGKSANRKDKPGSKSKQQPVQLPGFLQAFLAGSQLIVVLVGLAVFVGSLAAGTSFLTVLIRSGVSILVTGAIMWLLSWQAVRGSIDILYETKKAALEEQSSQTESTVEKQV